jgi:hypothetical protein
MVVKEKKEKNNKGGEEGSLRKPEDGRLVHLLSQ